MDFQPAELTERSLLVDGPPYGHSRERQQRRANPRRFDVERRLARQSDECRARETEPVRKSEGRCVRG